MRSLLLGLGALGVGLAGLAYLSTRSSDGVPAWLLRGSRPCTELAASWILGTLYGPPGAGASLTAWRALSPGLWDAIQVVNSAKPWSGPEAVSEATGNAVLRGGSGNPPSLSPGRWYYVQRWLPDFSKGHAYMVMRLGERGYRIVQTSALYGYRDDVASSWVKPGYLVAAVEV